MIHFRMQILVGFLAITSDGYGQIAEPAPPLSWKINGLPIGAVVCFASVGDRNTAENALRAPPFEPRNLSWKATIQSARSLSAFEFDIPTGFPPKPRESFVPSGDMAKDVESIIASASKHSVLGDELRRRLLLSPLAHWRASPDIKRKYPPNTTVILEPNCLVTEVVAPRQEAVYFDAPIWQKLPHRDQVTIVIEYLLSAVASQMRDQTPFRSIVGLLIAKSAFGELSDTKRFQLLWPLELPAYRTTIEGRTLQLCRSSFDASGKLNSYVYVSSLDTEKIVAGDWALTPRRHNCREWYHSDPSIEVENDGKIRLVHSEVATNGSFELRGSIFSRQNGELVPGTWAPWVIRHRDQTIRLQGNISIQNGNTLHVTETSEGALTNAQGSLSIGYGRPTMTFFPDSLSPRSISKVLGKVWFDGSLHHSKADGKVFGVVLDEGGRVIGLIN